MNNPTSAPATNPPPPKLPPQSAEVQQLMREKANLCQMLWELVRLHSPDTETVELPTTASNPLWQLAFVRGSEDGKVKLMAGLHPEMTDAQQKRVVRFLRDTSKKIEEAMISLELPFPPLYVDRRISDRITWKDGKWISVTPAGLVEKAKNAVHWPA